MPLIEIDEQVAVIAVDLQKGIGGRLASFPAVVDNSRRLVQAFRARGLPVVLVNVAGGPQGRTDLRRARADQGRERPARPEGWTELLEELDAQPDDIRVTKHSWGAFHDTGLAETLAARDVTQVVIAGVATSVGVESTARDAYAHGFNVVLAVDAMTDPSGDAHRNSVTRIFPRLGETATTGEVLEKLRSRADAGDGR